MAEEVRIWFDPEADYLEVLFDRKEGYFRETECDATRGRGGPASRKWVRSRRLRRPALPKAGPLVLVLVLVIVVVIRR